MAPPSQPRPPPYRPCGPQGPDCAEVCFPGTFEGAPVHWHARIVTLRALARDRPGAARRPYLQVGDVTDGRARIEVGLNVEHLDPPTILKAVIMVRQYKGLRRGRHEFGPPLQEGGP